MNEDRALQPPADAFGAALLLLTVVADARACQARLLELQAAERSAKKAQTGLAAERAALDQHAAKTRLELDQRETAARKREVAAKTAERHLAADLARVNEFKAKHLLQPMGNGLVREYPDAATQQAMRGT